jgi:hypothetical protein
MPDVKFFGPTVRFVIDDNFDSPELKKSIAKKAENEIVLSSTGAMLSMAERNLHRLTAARRRNEIIDRQSDWMRLRELSRMRNT